jgi:glycosyltransferase involved in cell wall biosynthesis
LPEKVKKNFNESGDGGLDWGKVFGVLFRSHRVLSEADAVVTCNTKEAALLREQDPSRRVVVQSHGVPLEMYRVNHREAARVAFPQIQGRELLLCLGRVDPIKNQHWLLEQSPAAFRAHPNAMLVLAGACTDEPYGKLIDNKIKELGLQEKVLLTGGLPQGDPRLLGLLQEAKVLLLPSLSETFGLVLLEAWAAGTMVISSRTSGASALIQHAYNGWLFDLDDPPGFHKALNWTLTDTELCRQMVSRGANRVEEEFSIRAVTGKIKSLYEELQGEFAHAA